MASKKPLAKPIKKESINPFIQEFQQTCKSLNFQDQETITKITTMMSKFDTKLHFSNMIITSSLSKVILKFIQKYIRLQQLSFFSCVFQDPTFLSTLAAEFSKNTANILSLDFAPISREEIIPFLTTQSLEILSLRGVQTITSYDYKTHESKPFPPSLNLFCNSLVQSPLRVLNLFDCHIGDDGAISIATALMFNSTLQCLSLVKNHIGDKGAIALSRVLSKYVLDEREIQIVDVLIQDENKSKISDDGGNLSKKKKGQKAAPKKPAPSPQKGRKNLRKNQEVINFDPHAQISAIISEKWRECQIDGNGDKFLAGNRTITTLLLDENEIKKDGINALHEMLSINAVIVNFSVLDNPENDDLLRSLSRKQETHLSESAL